MLLVAPESAEISAQSLPFDGVVDTYNKRIKIYDVSAEAFDTPLANAFLESFHASEAFTKLTIYSRDQDQKAWQELGFHTEATIEGYFRGGDSALLLTQYNQHQRAEESRVQVHEEILSNVSALAPRSPLLAEGYSLRVATPTDAEEIHALMSICFQDYPSDFSAPRLAKLIADQKSHFRLAINPQGEISALASIELNHKHLNAELTDCATLPAERGKGLMSAIMHRLELDAWLRFGIRDLYTIARATEVGMNRAFARSGFTYSGRLINNCRMPLGWESMNVWCKRSTS